MEQIKKYIRGNKERGHDVIAELEKLGGKNILKLKGDEYDKVYYIARYKYADTNTIDLVTDKSFIGQLIVTHPDWEEIELPKIFKDGDVVFYDDNIAIFKEWGDAILFRTYANLYIHRESIDIDFPLFGKYVRKETRFATEDEKQKLFAAIKDNGYKWNPQEKTLERLIVPKFKVGDRVKHKESYISGVVTKIYDKCYKIKYDSGAVSFANIKYQDDYELVHEKFDITTLKPFDKVLVRDNYQNYWAANLYSHYMNANEDYHFATVFGYYRQCIPYNDETKHLLGKADDCENYYKTWEE